MEANGAPQRRRDSRSSSSSNNNSVVVDERVPSKGQRASSSHAQTTAHASSSRRSSTASNSAASVPAHASTSSLKSGSPAVKKRSSKSGTTKGRASTASAAAMASVDDAGLTVVSFGTPLRESWQAEELEGKRVFVAEGNRMLARVSLVGNARLSERGVRAMLKCVQLQHQEYVAYLTEVAQKSASIEHLETVPLKAFASASARKCSTVLIYN